MFYMDKPKHIKTIPIPKIKIKLNSIIYLQKAIYSNIYWFHHFDYLCYPPRKGTDI